VALLHRYLFLEILADRKLHPAAVRLRLGTTEAATPVLPDGGDELPGLAALLPCVVTGNERTGLPAGVTEGLQAAGCLVVDDDAIFPVDDLGSVTLPDTATYLAGGWYLRPPLKPGGTQHASRALALQLLQLVAADADTHEIEAIFRHEPSLSYHLLRLVNSLTRGGKRITSFAQAILILGRQQLRRWLNLILFAAQKEDPRSQMLTARVSVRARSMELLAKAAGLDKAHQEAAFMAGMFSLLGALFGMPLAEVLKPLNVSEELSAALLRMEGDLGTMLATVIAAENADAILVAGHLGELGIPDSVFNEVGIAAVAWMLEVVAEATGGAHV
jgi:EAL and modified HD-GYP domain-containing signal transduction protein